MEMKAVAFAKMFVYILIKLCKWCHILEDHIIKVRNCIIYLITIYGIIRLIMVPWCWLVCARLLIQHMLMVEFYPLKHTYI